MKIIKEGDMRKLKRTRQFECDKCGCIFEADDNEYVTDYPYYSVNCPFCNNRVYAH